MAYSTLGRGHRKEVFHQISGNSFRAVWKHVADKRDFPVSDNFCLNKTYDPFAHRGCSEQIGFPLHSCTCAINLSRSFTFLLLFTDNCFSSLEFFTHFASISKKSYYFFSTKVFLLRCFLKAEVPRLCCAFRACAVGQQPRRLLMGPKQSGCAHP